MILSVLLVLFICLIRLINSQSVIDVIYIIASYTYGPLLGMFAFGLLTKRLATDKLVPWIAIASPLLCYAIDFWVGRSFGYKFGYELLMLNGLITFTGLYLFSNRPEKVILVK